MGLGINYQSGGGDFMPVLKYDARVGEFFRIDRTQDSSGGWQTNQEKITAEFKAVFDLENIEVGWLYFKAGVAPDVRTRRIIDGDPGPNPSDNHKQGFRLLLKLAASCGGDKPLRELSGNAKTLIEGVDKLYDAYLAGVKDNPGKLPVVSLGKPTAKTTQGGGQKSTNYIPTFVIDSWVARPADLVWSPKDGGAAPATPESKATPPSTGSKPVGAPAPKAAAPAGADDFG